MAASGLWFDEQRRHAHRLRGMRGRSPDTGTAVEQRFLGRQIQLVDQPVHRRTAIDPQQPLERAELTVERARVARQRRSQTQITALGNLPNAVIGEPVTSMAGHDVLRHRWPAQIGVSASRGWPIPLPGRPVRACWPRRRVLPELRPAWPAQPRWLSARPR